MKKNLYLCREFDEKKMNTKEFAERCNVSPQIVRLWIRSGKLRKEDGKIWLNNGYILLPHLAIRKGEGERRITKGHPGVCRRTILNWLRDGKVVKGDDGILYVREGMELQTCYRPVLRKIDEEAERMWEEMMAMEEKIRGEE